MFKSELVVFADKGIVGVLIKKIEDKQETNYVKLQIRPLNSIKTTIIKQSIHRDNIHSLHAVSDESGVIPKIMFVYTGQEDSIVKNVLNADNERRIRELEDENRKLRMSVSAHKQDSIDARSGVNKAISSMKAVNRQQQPQHFINDDFLLNQRQRQQNQDKNNFDGMEEGF